jgi:hypothetical protein
VIQQELGHTFSPEAIIQCSLKTTHSLFVTEEEDPSVFGTTNKNIDYPYV